MTDLYVRYRRLLLAYPRDYRRHRGAEIATTYTEMATEGQRWPRGRDAVSLLRHGLRARLGRPRSRLVVPLTVLAMLVGGLSAAAAGAWAGWGGSTGLTARQQAEIGRLAPTPRTPFTTNVRDFDATPTWWGVYLSMPALGTDPDMVESKVDPATGQIESPWPGPSLRELVDHERARLTASGWTVSGQTVTDNRATMTVRSDDLIARLDATTGWTSYVAMMNAASTTPGGDTACIRNLPLGTPESGPGSLRFLECEVSIASASGSVGFSALVYRTTPATVPVFASIAGLLGAAVTYLLVGWVNRQAGRLAIRPRRIATAGLALTTALATPAALLCAGGLWTALTHRTEIPIRYWGGFVTGEPRYAALAAAVLLVVTLGGAALTRPTSPAIELAEEPAAP